MRVTKTTFILLRNHAWVNPGPEKTDCTSVDSEKYSVQGLMHQPGARMGNMIGKPNCRVPACYEGYVIRLWREIFLTVSLLRR